MLDEGFGGLLELFSLDKYTLRRVARGLSLPRPRVGPVAAVAESSDGGRWCETVVGASSHHRTVD
jgi:hypothetical protein